MGRLELLIWSLWRSSLAAFAFNARITLHLIFNRGRNRHHIVEASFKALAVALRRGLTQNRKGIMPSTKGVL